MTALRVRGFDFMSAAASEEVARGVDVARALLRRE